MDNPFTYNNHPIHYKDIGSGKPVLLIHGFAENSNVWNNQIAFLQNHCRLIVPDLPGSGKSDFNEYANSIESMAESVAILLNKLLLTSCIVIGHSMGGHLSLALAEKFPTLVKSLGLIHSTAFADGVQKQESRRKSILAMQQNELFSFLQTASAGIFTDDFKQQYPEKLQEHIQMGMQASKEALITYYQAMLARPSRTNVIVNAKLPVFFLIGAQDKAVPMQEMLEQTHLPAAAYIHILKKSAHMGIWEEKDLANEYLLQYILEID